MFPELNPPQLHDFLHDTWQNGRIHPQTDRPKSQDYKNIYLFSPRNEDREFQSEKQEINSI